MYSVHGTVRFVKGPYSSVVPVLLVRKKTVIVTEPRERSMGDMEIFTIDKFSFILSFFVGHRKGQLHTRF